MILNFSPPTAQVQNTYTAPTRTNPYLTSSQYEGMQLHTPSGLFYQGGTMYQPYTPAPVTYNPFSWWGNMNNNSPRGGPVENSIQIGNQYFKPFTGNAQGIVDGNLSMVSMLNQQPMYQPQPMQNLFPSLNANLSQLQPMLSSPSYGAGRFTGLLNSPITTNTQGK